MQVHPSQITPGENFDIFFFLRNPTDTSTYYVQAVIYDVRTGVILASTNLTQSPGNPHLFVKTLQAPTDTVGMGRNIVAVASLYTDPGMTQKSPDYEEQEQYFLIKAAPVAYGGEGVDYRELREIVQEELQKAVKSIKMPETTQLPDMPFASILGAIGALQREINRIPKEDGDLSPLTDRLTAIQRTLSALPPPEKLDLTAVTGAVAQLSDQINQLQQTVLSAAETVTRSQATGLRQLAFQLDAAMKGNIEEALGNHEFSVSYPSMPTALKSSGAKKAAPAAADVSSLMNV